MSALRSPAHHWSHHVVWTVMDIESLTRPGDGAKEWIVAADALLPLVETDHRAFGVGPSALHRTIEIDRDPSKSQLTQACEHEGSAAAPRNAPATHLSLYRVPRLRYVSPQWSPVLLVLVGLHLPVSQHGDHYSFISVACVLAQGTRARPELTVSTMLVNLTGGEVNRHRLRASNSLVYQRLHTMRPVIYTAGR